MSIDLAPNNPYGLALRNPVLAAAGCLGYGVEAARALDLAQLGALVTRTTTPEPRRAVQRPRLIETPAGLLAAGPWPNPGLRAVLERHAPVWASWDTPVILSMAAQHPREYAQMAGALEGVAGIAGVELSVTAAAAVAATQTSRAATQLPLLVRLPPLDDAPLADLVQAVVAAGADALTLAAPPLGMGSDPDTGEPITGWLCGPALLPLTLRRLADLAAGAGVPVVGCGGIANTDAVQQCLAAGATAVQVGSALLADPFRMLGLVRALGEVESDGAWGQSD